MASNPIEARIDAAITRLCTDLHAKYINFWDRSTLQPLEFGAINSRRIIATGTYACGVWQAGEDIHLVSISNNTTETFWNYLKENLYLAEDAKLPKRNDEANIELSASEFSRKVDSSRCILPEFANLSRKDKASCSFYLHYAEAPSNHIMNNMECELIPENNSKFDRIPQAHNFNMIRDIQLLSFDETMQPEKARLVFIQGYLDLRCWAKSNGLIGSKLGFLDCNNLIWLVYGTCIGVWSLGPDDPVDRQNDYMLTAMLKRLQQHLRLQYLPGATISRKLDHEISPERLVGSTLTPEAKQAIETAILRTERAITDDGTLRKEPEQAFEDFLGDFHYFFKVECECWANMLELRTDFQAIAVPNNLNKAVEFFRHSSRKHEHGIIGLRIWPVPVIHTDDQKQQVYAVGIRTSRDELHNLERFVKRRASIGNEIAEKVLDYDPNNGLITFALCTSHDFEGISTEGNRVQPSNMAFATPPPPSTGSGSSLPPKFRTARSALSRLRHDPKHAEIKYEVGYEDRFVSGLVWLPLELWGGKAVEDEDFIPEHRIRQLRRLEDEVVVWDRTRKIDLT